METRHYSIRIPRRWAHVAITMVLTAAVVAPVTALAAGRFTDVPATNTFVNDIEWLADAGVTRGCNPPQNTRYCPDDTVTRGQMAAFLKRLATNRVVDAGALGGTPASAYLSELTTATANRVGMGSKSIEAKCPAGHVATGGGAYALSDTNFGIEDQLVVRTSGPTFDGANPTGWIAFAEELTPLGEDWRLTVRVICAKTG
jgi:hypothetical protein